MPCTAPFLLVKKKKALLGSPRWSTQHGDKEWNRTCFPIEINPFITHPAHEKFYHTIGVYVPYSLRTTTVWVLLRPTRIRIVNSKNCETRPTDFRPFPRSLECLCSLFRCFVLPCVVIYYRREFNKKRKVKLRDKTFSSSIKTPYDIS